MEKKKSPHFKTFVEAARHQLEAARVPNFETYFDNIESFNPMMGYLDSVLYILDFRTGKITYMGPNSMEVQGYSAEEMMSMGPLDIMEQLYHPRDAEIIATQFFPEGNEELLKIMDADMSRIKISYNYRLKQKDGTYRTLLQQFSYLMMDEDKNALMIMGTVTDIHEIHHRPELFGRIHQKDKNGVWKKMYERMWPLAETAADSGLSPKELEIIRFVNKGLSSKEIAQLTNRSVETVNVQRKKILSKTACQSMMEVIALANKNGWV